MSRQEEPPERGISLLYWVIWCIAVVAALAFIIAQFGIDRLLILLGVLLSNPVIIGKIERALPRFIVPVSVGLLCLGLGILIGNRLNPQNHLPDPQVNLPDIASISVRYREDDYNPHIIDLREVGEVGIPASPGSSLALEDLWVWASSDAPGYVVQAEVYANASEFIGNLSSVPVSKGAFELGDINPTAFQHPTVENAWLVQQDWEELTIYLYLSPLDESGEQQEFVKLYTVSIPFDPEGRPWLWDAPYARFIGIAYTINDGPERLLDLRHVQEDGLSVEAGDVIRVTEAWYKADSESATYQIGFSGYLTAAGYDESTEVSSPGFAIAEGVQMMSFDSDLSWAVQPDDRFWVISLVRAPRDDRTLLDRFVIPLN